MKKFKGKKVRGGIASGFLKYVEKDTKIEKLDRKIDSKEEVKKYISAKIKTEKNIYRSYKKAEVMISKEDAEIFKVHKMILNDETFNKKIINLIEGERVSAIDAVNEISKEYIEKFSSMIDPIIKERYEDIIDIKDQLLSYLRETNDVLEKNKITNPTILVSERFSPSEIIRIDEEKVKGIVSIKGSRYSHSLILARAMKIPIIREVNIKREDLVDGCEVIIDAEGGYIYISPDEKIKKEMEEKARLIEIKKEDLEEYKEKKITTKSGKEVLFLGDISGIDDILEVKKNKADGIGLFRTEFNCLKNNAFLKEEEQFELYSNILNEMNGKIVNIRTLDIGVDKQIGGREGGALGIRGIRYSLDNKEEFKAQIRALLRASIYGNLYVTFPFITSKWEVLEALKIVDDEKSLLFEKGVKINPFKIGIMIETPAAALISDELARLVDFFCIGTNDLLQYTLVADRSNEKLSPYRNPNHAALKKLIKMTVKNANKENKFVCICGELSSYKDLISMYMDIEVSALSMTPDKIPFVKKNIKKPLPK